LRRVAVDGGEVRPLADGWRLAGTPPGELADATGLDGLEWIAAEVPGTVAGALRRAADGGWEVPAYLDGRDWWFARSFDVRPQEPAELLVLWLDGLATVAEVYLNGERLLDSDSMFARHALVLGDRLRDHNELAICCRALRPLLATARKPRARWRTRLVADGNLRFHRTMLLGRAPGFAPGPPVVGPWRAVVLERRHRLSVDELKLRAGLRAGVGILQLRARVRPLGPEATLGPATVALTGPTGIHRAPLVSESRQDGWVLSGCIEIPCAEPWWPHTHGQPALYRVAVGVRLAGAELSIDAGRVGFRALHSGPEIDRDGLRLTVNGEEVFCRGAVWTPLDLTAPDASEPELRRALGLVVDGGMNMLRVPGIGCYESELFHDLCDELGVLVWQDFMFANLDYPESDPDFMQTVEREADQLLDSLGSRPSLAVLCGGSEVAQQVAMLGLDPALANGPLYGELLPALVARAGVDAPYIPSTPWGGALPFMPDRGVANYYGVGAYLRPLADARLSEVKFAAECLALANVPDEPALEAIQAPGGLAVHDPRWKAGVPRDAGAGWDFEDVRDHYLQLLFGVDPTALRSVDQDRYLELSRQVSGEVMAEVFGEWRRGGSPCAGGLVLWLKDLVPGAGWGLLDHRGEAKVAYHLLRRALAPVAVWSTDEGLRGIAAHVANDRPAPLRATLRVALYRDYEVRVHEATRELELAPRSQTTVGVEELVGRFVDAAWAYRFGPPAQDLIVLSLEQDADDGVRVLSQACRFPAGRPTSRQSAAHLGLTASVSMFGSEARLIVSCTRLAYGVRPSLAGFAPVDDAFFVEPGRQRTITMKTLGDDQLSSGTLTALNLSGRVPITIQTP
jgi:beta-mannosidase